MKIEIEKKKADWRVLYCICLYFSEYCTVLTGRTVRWMSLITKRTIRYDIIQCTVWMYEVSTVHSVLYTFRKLDQSRNFGGRLAVIKFTVYYQCTLYSTVLYCTILRRWVLTRCYGPRQLTYMWQTTVFGVQYCIFGLDGVWVRIRYRADLYCTVDSLSVQGLLEEIHKCWLLRVQYSTVKQSTLTYSYDSSLYHTAQCA